MPFLHEVFQLSGVPKITYVEPEKYQDILVSMRTPGRCLVLEGPSGIGKSTLIQKVLDELGIEKKCLSLNSRDANAIQLIEALPEMHDIGTVVVDDFHRLPEKIKEKLSDFMKVLADTENSNSKLILIGINKAGHKLVNYAHDLGLRLDVFKLETNSDEKVEQLISLGESALNVKFANKANMTQRAEGSFQIAQLLCHKLCTMSKVVETQSSLKNINLSFEVVIEEVMTDLARIFKNALITFARGSKLRKEGRAPYLHMLRWLADGSDWSLDLTEAMHNHPINKQSISQVLEKGYLSALLDDPEKEKILTPYFHFDQSTGVLSVEDPRLIFYLKNIVWRAFTQQCGYTDVIFPNKYDFALSFAGADRSHAETLHKMLTEREVACFYDIDEQHRILASNVEEYLAPIYRSEARYVVPFLSTSYPNRIWTKFESDQFRERFGTGAVISIRYLNAQPGYFSDEQRYGALSFDPSGNIQEQLLAIADTLCKRLIEDRHNSQPSLLPEATA